VWRFAQQSIFMSVIQFHLKLSWRNLMQVGGISMMLRLKNYFHMTRIITEDWKPNDALAARAGIGKGARVVDFCAGLGGPSRYLAHRYGGDVTGIELTPARVKGAEKLTRLVGLQSVVRIIEGNVMHVPLSDATVDVVVSQETLLHVPDKLRTLTKAYRILKPGGRVAFTDWVTSSTFRC
jgi:ubiquinone/menaquinone biosynthesis C-methylase UbiE